MWVHIPWIGRLKRGQGKKELHLMSGSKKRSNTLVLTDIETSIGSLARRKGASWLVERKNPV